jgi:putative flippase GtrA
VVKESTNGIKSGAALAGVGTGLGTLIIWLLNTVGVDLPPAASAAVAGGVATLTVYVMNHGLVGFGQMVWRGKDYVEEKETITPKKRVR